MTKNEFINDCLLKMNSGALDLLAIRITDQLLFSSLIHRDDYNQTVSTIARLLDNNLPNPEEVQDTIVDEIVNSL